MDTKDIIVPRGKSFIKDGKKIDDKYLLKYSSKQLIKKWNIWKLKIEGKKDINFYRIDKKSYRELKSDHTIILTLTHIPKYSVKELKERKLQELYEAYKNLYLSMLDESNGKFFLDGKTTDLNFIKASYDIEKAAVNALTNYDDIINYVIMKDI